MPEIRLSELIPPSFYDVHDAVKHHKYGTYRLKGGRGSGKSSMCRCIYETWGTFKIRSV